MAPVLERWLGASAWPRAILRGSLVHRAVAQLAAAAGARPLRLAGSLLVPWLLLNSAILWRTGQDAGTWGWPLRGVLLGLGVLACTCPASWATLLRTSFVARWWRAEWP